VICLGAAGTLASEHILRSTRSNPPQASVAVLPFVNLSPDKSDEYLSDGITEEITNTLARIPGLRVAARSAAYRFKGEGADLHDVGRQLGVATVLEGSVRTSGDTLRITAQLVDAVKGYNLWSESYDGRRAEILTIQIRIAQAIAGNLRLKLAETQGDVSIRPTRNPAAHELVLQARYMQPDTPESDARIRCYQRALALDPEYAPAYAGLADEWLRQAVEGWSSPREVMERAREATNKALQLDDTLPDAHFLSAMVKWSYEWDWSGARREFERSLQINPNFANARMQYARYLALLGFRREAVDQLDQIRVLDPISAPARGVEAAVYYLVGDYDRTIRHARAVLAGDPNLWLMYYWMGRAYDSRGQLSEAIPVLEKWYSMPDRLQGRGFGMLGSVYARAGRRNDAVRLLESALERSRHAHVSPTSFALIYTGLGESAHALEWLEKAYEERDHSLVTLKSDPAYNSLRRDPRFVALLRKMNLD
jgi:TolB-like protein